MQALLDPGDVNVLIHNSFWWTIKVKMLRVTERLAGIISSVTGEEAINSLARLLVYSIYVIY